MISSDNAQLESPSEASAGPHRLPRFGLRSLFVGGLVFCLLLGWIGKGYQRVRQEDAAIETILRSGGSLYTGSDRRHYGAPRALSEPSSLPLFERGGDLFFRSVGWRKRPPVETVELRLSDAGDPVADEATAALALLHEVRTVSLTGPAFDDASLRALDRLPRLETLHLVRTSVTANGMQRMASPERIRKLHVHDQGSEGNVLAGSGVLRGLKAAEVVNCTIARDDVTALASLPELETLDLLAVQLVGDDALVPLAEAQGLRSLDFLPPMRPLEPDELQALAAAPALERLEIPVAEADLPPFASSKRLRFLLLRPYEPIPEEAVRDLSLELPECVIGIRGPLRPYYLQNGERVERPASERVRY